MAVVKIMKVNHLMASIKYVLKPTKTEQGKYVTSYECSPSEKAVKEMTLYSLTKRKQPSQKMTNYAYMIIQSFAPGEVTADQAFEIGQELAKTYLLNEHQYMMTTHVDRDHIHNHIVFNATNHVKGIQFNAKRANFVDRIREVSDQLCEKHGLSVIKEPKQKGISQKEYYARKYDRSYKGRLEKIIDNAIKNADSWQDFLEIMMNICEIKYGKYIAFKLEDQQRFTRGRTLGLDYSEESIMYRIAHKEFEIERIPRFRYIDKSQVQFQGKDKEGLRSWATTQNIQAMAELIKTMDKEQLSLVAIREKVATLQNEMRDYGSKIDQLDQQIKSEREVLRAYEVYVDSYALISNYKKAEDKEKYKTTHVHEFQNYDHAKAILSKHKGKDGKMINPDTRIDRLESLQVEREILYNQYQGLKSDFSKLSSSARTAEVLEREKNKSFSR